MRNPPELTPHPLKRKPRLRATNPGPSITTTLRQEGTLSTTLWRLSHALDSFVDLPSARR